MPNYCNFNMRITGPKESVERFIKAATVNYHCGEPDEPEHFWRVENFEVTNTQVKGNLMQVDAYGECAWKVAACFRRDGYQLLSKPHNGVCLEDFTKKHMLIVEYFSTECGCCFSEHGLIKFGQWEIDECNDYYEFTAECDVEDFNTVTRLKLTQEEFNGLFTNRECLIVGEPSYEFKDYLEVL